MKMKKLLAMSSLAGLSLLTLASCSEESTLNSSIPTNGIDLNATVATALDGSLKLTNKTYYNKLRNSGYSIVFNKLKEALYTNELDALWAVLKNENYNNLTEAQKNLLIPTKNNEKLFELDGTELSVDGSKTNYEYIRYELLKSLNSSISSNIYGSASAESIDDLEDKDKNDKIKKFITERARMNQTFVASDLTYTKPTDDSDIVSMDHLLDDVFKKYVNDLLITEAQNLAAQNALYQIADEEYINKYNDDADADKSKNTSYYLYDSEGDYLKNNYESKYQTYGTYHAIIVQFDSLKIATKYTKNVKFNETDTLDQIKSKYLDIYNDYYKYNPQTDYDCDAFTFTVSKDKNDFNDISSNISTLIKDTLEEDSTDLSKQYLSEPRNIDNKYVMALKYNTIYDVSGDTTETEWDDLSDADKAKYTVKIKYDLLTTNKSGYATTNFKSMIYTRSNNTDENDDIFIYDPIFEHQFENTYTDDYNEINKSKFKDNLVFSIKIDDNKTIDYSVVDFYNDATTSIGSSTIYSYFQLEYAYKYYDEFVDTDTHDSNVETLDNTITDFNDGNNSSYSAEFGLENFLVAQYGYDNKDDVIKYYYDAKTCLSSYLSKAVYKEWAVESPDNDYTYDTTLADNGILKNILTLGNSKYADMFNINLDHVLIYIDADGDGSPDDPEEFLSKNSVVKDDFENAVAELLQAIYDEAIYIRENYAKTKSLYEIITYIRDQYDLGEDLLSDSSKNWDDYKTYNFLVKTEQLASSSDITESTVSNFVKPFKEYVINVYKTCVKNNVQETYKYGSFYAYDTVNETGKVVDAASDITPDTLCATQYGYHLLILNSYKTPDGTDYTESDDPSGIQSAIKVLVYEDKDDDTKDVYITTNSYNEKSNEISFNQLFIYYCQKAMSQSSSLDSSIQTIMSSLFNDAINTYVSSNFQNYLLISYLKITSDNETVTKLEAAEKDYYQNVTINYDSESDYYDWLFGDLDWTRPDQK